MFYIITFKSTVIIDKMRTMFIKIYLASYLLVDCVCLTYFVN